MLETAFFKATMEFKWSAEKGGICAQLIARRGLTVCVPGKGCWFSDLIVRWGDALKGCWVISDNVINRTDGWVG